MTHRTLHFILHYVEMVVAMLAGMLVLGGGAALVLDVGSWREDVPELLLLGMAFTMTLPMVAWMRVRGHRWAPAADMTAAMFVPTFAAIALLWAGVFDGVHGPLMVQHIAMFPAMLLAMLLRPREYAH